MFKSNRSKTLWFVTIVSLSLSIGVFFTVISSDYNNEIQDYSSELSFWFWNIVFILLSNTLIAAVFWISGKYILKLELISEDEIEVYIWRVIGNKKLTYKLLDIGEVKYYEGRADYVDTPKVNAPWLKIDFGNKNYMLDLQGELPYGYTKTMEIFKRKLRIRDNKS